MTRVLLGSGVVGAGLFVAVFVVDGATRPGYRPAHHPVSALALGPRGWVQTANFIVTGLLMIAAAAGLRAETGLVIGPALLAIFGVSLVASGIFPMDAMQGYPPGTPLTTPTVYSRSHRLHDVFGFLVFSALPAACFAFAISFTGGWRIYSFTTAAALVALFVVFGIAMEAEAPRTGLIQRLMIVVGWTWIGLVCLYLMP